MSTTFRTEIEIDSFGFNFDHSGRAFLVGSCFVENITAKLSDAKFNAVCNPFGIIYNPLSIAGMMDSLVAEQKFTECDLTPSREGDLWCNFSFHGSFSGTDPYDVLEGMNSARVAGTEALLNSDLVVITFGTSWIYELASSGNVVANCHKFPQAMFSRRRMSVDEIVELYEPLLSGVLKDKQVIFTVSPIRHLKDGLRENALSKAILKLAVEEIVEKFDNAHYFPSFEIIIDDLRDYRFYADDMLHPSTVAVDYIWEHLQKTLFSEATIQIMRRIEKITNATRHRAFNPGSQAHIKFQENTLMKIEELLREHPEIDFNKEIEFLTR